MIDNQNFCINCVIDRSFDFISNVKLSNQLLRGVAVFWNNRHEWLDTRNI